MSKQRLQIYLSTIILFFGAACSTGPNSSPGGAVVLAMDAIVKQDIQLLIKATHGSRSGTANPREIGVTMNQIVAKFSVGRNAKVTIDRTFKRDKDLKATVYFSLVQDGKKEQFVMRAERKGVEWVAILDSIAKTDKAVW
jgi:hypothetical protein